MLENNDFSQIPENGIKFSMRVDSWPFRSIQNRLLISMKTDAIAKENESCNQFVATSTTTDKSNNLRSISVHLNGATLYLVGFGDNSISTNSPLIFRFSCFPVYPFDVCRYGRFANKGYLDDEIRNMQFYYNDTAQEAVIEVAHFWDYMGLYFHVNKA